MADVPRYVIDASVATKWHLDDETYVQENQTILDQFQQGRIHLLAPDHIRYEVASAILNATRMNPPRIAFEAGRRSIGRVGQWGVDLVLDAGLLPSAYLLARRWGCSLYDALYLALAQAAQSPLIHADDRLRRALAGRFPLELWIEDYQPADIA